MYYSKYDYYIMVFGCACLLVFLAIIFINPKDNTKNVSIAESKVIDKDEVDKKLDALSQELETIRQRLKKQEETAKGSL